MPNPPRLPDDWPQPMLLLDGAGQVVEANPAARELLAGVDVAWPAGAGQFDLPATGDPIVRACIGAPAADGLRRVTLMPVGDLRAELTRLAERLDTVQTLGRLGTWERDMRTLEGRWDRHTMRIFGLSEGPGSPSVELSLSRIVPEDEQKYRQTFRASLQQAGSYSHRHRVRHPDGSLRHVFVQWIVRNGADGRPQYLYGVISDETEAWELAQQRDEALRRIEAAVDLARVAIFETDLKTLHVRHNRHALELLGVDPATLGPNGLTVKEVRTRVHPDDDQPLIEAAQRAVQTGQVIDSVVRYRHGEGWRHVLSRRVVRPDSQGQPVTLLGVGLDVTAQREADERSQALSRRFELVTRAAGLGHWSQDLASGKIDWSPELFRLHGRSESEGVPTFGEWLGHYVVPEEREAVLQAFRQWGADGFPRRQLQYRVRRPDGSFADLVSHASAEGGPGQLTLFGVVVDVTDRREAELALRRAGERAALVAEALGIGTWEFDFASGASQWDEQMWRLRGIAPAAAVPDLQARQAFVHPEDRAMALAAFERGLREPDPIDIEFRVVWPDGSVHWLASRSVALLDAEGKPSRRIGVNWDTTAARAAALAHEEKVAAQREVQAKSRFLSRMSHELRTPLNAVLGFTDLMLTSAPRSRSAQDRRRLDHIRAAGTHLLELIDDVLDLSRLEGGEVAISLQPVPLDEALPAVLPLVDAMARRHDVTLQFDGGGTVALADPTRFRQVLLNLLSNAIKYNRPGGEVRVVGRAEDGGVLLVVADNGLGMTAKQQQHLFEPFNRLGAERSAIEGTGIGLAIVKALVERMGGSVAVQSEAGRGSRFELRLREGRGALLPSGPLASPQLMALAASHAPLGRAGRLLYIEDNPVNAMIVAELIERRRDLQLEVAEDGESGIAAASARLPDLILLDMQLPDMDGMQVFATLREQPATADVPCIALSANAMPADIERALSAGFADYWTKPLDFRAFMASIDTLFGPPPRPDGADD